MKPSIRIRRELDHIDGAVVDVPPDERPSGDDKEYVPIWTGEEQCLNETVDINQCNEWDSSDHTELDPIFEYGTDETLERAVKQLGKDELTKIRKAVELHGIDKALAWYVSYHYRGLQWGIYIPVSGLIYLAVDVFQKLQCDLLKKVRLAFRVLHQHELFHFAADYMASQLELITRKPCYVLSKPKLKNDDGFILWEESLANATMLRSVRFAPRNIKIKGAYAQMLKFVKKQPKGYRDAPDYVLNGPYVELAEKLASDYSAYIPNHCGVDPKTCTLWPLYGAHPHIDWKRCPVHLIHDEARFALPNWIVEYFGSISICTETTRFQKGLQRLGRQAGNRWLKTQQLLSYGSGHPSLDFKLWERRPSGSVYSVRLDKEIRAHLLYSQSEGWAALDVGHHKKMGHG